MPDTAATTQQSLGTESARKLATTSKSRPQMLGITPRYLLRLLPWRNVEAGAYRVNRQKTYAIGDGRISVTESAGRARVIAEDLRELPFLREAGPEVLSTLADSFVVRQLDKGEFLADRGATADALYVIAQGKVEKRGPGPYGEDQCVDVLAEEDFLGAAALVDEGGWEFGYRALTPLTVLALERRAFGEVIEHDARLLAALDAARASRLNGNAGRDIDVASGHIGEPDLPQTFADYEGEPREYELEVAQTVLRVHTRVAEIYNSPMDQTDQQIRLTVEALRERQEWEIINNPAFGLLHNVAAPYRVRTRNGPPTPDDLDELLIRIWKEPAFFLAHPAAIGAFGRECTRRGVPPRTIDLFGCPVITWRGVPLIPSDKMPLNEETGTSAILLMRVGEERQGVVGLKPDNIESEYAPGIAVQRMGVDAKAIISYLVTAYFSAAVLVEDAIGLLENVELHTYHDYAD